ncbi:MAG: YggS family pyridoxal phosphate-dependent enzyme [Spirochaetes bacterium]|nr:YggS family pyridoxal phosphate-dependent enzyme [Spirochaetota bacterium]
MGTIRENIERVKERIERAKDRAGTREGVTLVAVSKTYPVEMINEAVQAGVRDIGENRVQEAAQKYEGIIEGAKLHLVGHLQRNKVKRALDIFGMVQSIDKIETALEIDKRAAAPLDILIEINASGEPTKSGVSPDGLSELAEALASLRMIRVRGLMTIGPFTDDEKRIRDCFAATRKHFEALGKTLRSDDFDVLSMGMSSDYELAIEEGSNMVRIGTAIFGRRT